MLPVRFAALCLVLLLPYCFVSSQDVVLSDHINDVTVQYMNQPAAITMWGPGEYNWVQWELLKLQEIDMNDTMVAEVTGFPALDWRWVEVKNDTSSFDPTAFEVALQIAQLMVNSGGHIFSVQFQLRTYFVKEQRTSVFANETISTFPGQLKWQMGVAGWKFQSDMNRLRFGIQLRSWADFGGTAPPKSTTTTTPLPFNTTTSSPFNTTTSSPLNITTSSPLNITTTSPLNTTTLSPLNTTTAAPLNTTTAPRSFAENTTTTAAPLNTTTASPFNTTTTSPLNMTTTTASPLNTTTSSPLNTTTAQPFNTSTTTTIPFNTTTTPLNTTTTPFINITTTTSPLNISTTTTPLNTTTTPVPTTSAILIGAPYSIIRVPGTNNSMAIVFADDQANLIIPTVAIEDGKLMQNISFKVISTPGMLEVDWDFPAFNDSLLYDPVLSLTDLLSVTGPNGTNSTTTPPPYNTTMPPETTLPPLNTTIPPFNTTIPPFNSTLPPINTTLPHTSTTSQHTVSAAMEFKAVGVVELLLLGLLVMWAMNSQQ